MKGQTHGGKGSTTRPTNKRRFDENYENIFAKKAPEERVELDEGVHTAESDGRQRESKLREHVEGAGIQGQANQKQAVEPTTVVLDGIPTEEDAVKTVLILEWFSEAIGLELSKKWEPSKSYYGYKVVARIILPADQKQAVVFNFCPRCGKRLSGNPDWVHTCTPPEGYEREDKAGLFQPDQEPVAWLYETPAKDGFSELTLSFGYEPEFDGIIKPLFVESNPKHQLLSNEEIAELWGWKESGNTEMIRNFARAIEKAHGIGE